MTSDTWRLAGLIVPWESFEDGAAARQTIKSVERQIEKVSRVPLVDTRNQLPSQYEDLIAPEGEHVDFNGEVTYREVCQTAAGKRFRRFFLRAMIGCFVLGSLGLISMFLTEGLVAYSGAVLAIFTGILLFRLGKHPFGRGQLNVVAFHVRGWCSADGVFTHAATGQSFRDWSQYNDFEISENVICLRLPGSVAAWQFLPQSIFVDQQGFQTACGWIRAGMVKGDRA